MGFLTFYDEPSIIFSGKKYVLDLSYDTVLSVQRMFREKRFGMDAMLMEALSIYGVPERDLTRLTWEERKDLLDRIFREKIEVRTRPKVGKQQRLVDFEDDGEYIYASFLQAYGIDLIDQRGKLPWKRFIALFQGLPEGTKIREVMRIRGAEIPAPNKYNQKEIQNLTELKAYYALGYKEGSAAQGFDQLFTTLEGMAR